jgi:import inner membrane translocase subunit TIM44
MQKAGLKVSDAVAEAVKAVETSEYYKKASAAVSSATEPIRSTETYKVVAASVAEALDDVTNNSRYGGYVEKEDRRRRREARLAKLGKKNMAAGGRKVEINPECVSR